MLAAETGFRKPAESFSFRTLAPMTKLVAIVFVYVVATTLSACTHVEVSVHSSASMNPSGPVPQCKLQRDLINRKQETDFWCWAAAAHTVIAYLKQDELMKQCDLLNAAVDLDPNNPLPDALNCCKATPDISPSDSKSTIESRNLCWINGWPEDVFERLPFTVLYDPISFDPGNENPQGLEWDEISTEICADRPIISAISYSGPSRGSHTIVIGGYKVLADGTQYVQVYDPGYSTLEEDYYVWPYDIYLGDPGVFVHVRDYKNISIP